MFRLVTHVVPKLILRLRMHMHHIGYEIHVWCLRTDGKSKIRAHHREVEK